jgi:hypothetical protein
MFEGAIASCNVVGIQVGVHIGGGEIVYALARVTLGDGPGIGTLGSGVVGNHGCSTLGDSVSVAIGFDLALGRIGRRLSHSF